MSLLESELVLESDSDAELDAEHVEEAKVVGCDEGAYLGSVNSEATSRLSVQRGGGKHFKHRSMFWVPKLFISVARNKKTHEWKGYDA